MFERGISKSDVKGVLDNGEDIALYEDDKPLPSFLRLGFINDRPLHVVASIDRSQYICYIITAYEPNLVQWNSDFKMRRDR